MRKLLPIILIALLLFGCNGQKPEGGNQTQVTSNQTEPVTGNGTIIITEVYNATTALPGNETVKTANVTDKMLNATPGTKYSLSSGERFAVYFIDVGDSELHGDAIFIKRGNFDVLIDAGPERNAGRVLDLLGKRNIDDIDILVSTHADEEHYGGIAAVASRYPVEELWWGGRTFGDSNYASIIEEVVSKGALERTVRRGDEFDHNNISLRILNPAGGSTFSDADNNAISIKVKSRDFCILLTSDLTSASANEMANREDVKCEIMQVPYHGLGKGNANIDVFLLKVQPAKAIVTGGIYDPTPDGRGTRPVVLGKITLKGIDYLEVYKGGSIKIESDGIDYAIEQGVE